MKKKKIPTRSIYTIDERMRRVWDVEEIKDLMSRRAIYLYNDMRREELNELWVSDEDRRASASLGSNWGYYVGMDEISYYYVVKHDADRKAQLEGYCKAHPNIENTLENQGYGCLVWRPASTPLVVLSGDGKYAKGMWYSIGAECNATGAGEAESRWLNDKIAADFVKEDDGWKIWHLVDSNDICVNVGANVDDLPTKPASGTWYPEIEFGEPTLRMLTHNGAMNWSDNYPPIPNPYFTYREDDSYGPKGHPNYED